MTSLAYYAAPFGGESDSKNESYIEKKRKNRTLKRSPTLKTHVQSMINEIHKSSDDDDSSEDLSDFDGIQSNVVPPMATQPKPTSYVPNLAKPTVTINSDNSLGDEPVSIESFNNLQTDYAQQYYNQYIPNIDQASGMQSQQQPPMQQKNLIEKLDHIIHLLEESKDEKTGHVTEELVLYSFLGVFIIFIVDSFARAGKYVR